MPGRRWILLAATIVAAPISSQPPSNKEPPPLDDVGLLQRVTASVDRGLAHLAKVQYPDGSWPSGYGGGGRNNGINGVAILSFLGRGHHPERGRYKDVLTRGRNYIISTQNEQGLYKSANQSHGPMYEHALATLAMVELYGMAADPKQEISVRKAITLLVRSQSPEGGWRYQPSSQDADV